MKKPATSNESVNDFLKFKTVNKLKSTYRMNSVEKRKESSAEHSWSCLVLADFLLNKYKLKLDRLKIYELLLYHDLVEIHSGDFPFHPGADRTQKEEKELLAARKLKEELPEHLAEKYMNLFEEFEGLKTPESKFAKAIDILDSQIHEIDYKSDWKGWTRDFLEKNKRAEVFNDFPQIKKEFTALLDYLEENEYFRQ